MATARRVGRARGRAICARERGGLGGVVPQPVGADQQPARAGRPATLPDPRHDVGRVLAEPPGDRVRLLDGLRLGARRAARDLLLGHRVVDGQHAARRRRRAASRRGSRRCRRSAPRRPRARPRRTCTTAGWGRPRRRCAATAVVGRRAARVGEDLVTAAAAALGVPSPRGSGGRSTSSAALRARRATPMCGVVGVGDAVADDEHRPRPGCSTRQRHRVLVAGVPDAAGRRRRPPRARAARSKWSRALGALVPHWLAVAVVADHAAAAQAGRAAAGGGSVPPCAGAAVDGADRAVPRSSSGPSPAPRPRARSARRRLRRRPAACRTPRRSSAPASTGSPQWGHVPPASGPDSGAVAVTRASSCARRWPASTSQHLRVPVVRRRGPAPGRTPRGRRASRLLGLVAADPAPVPGPVRSSPPRARGSRILDRLAAPARPGPSRTARRWSCAWSSTARSSPRRRAAAPRRAAARLAVAAAGRRHQVEGRDGAVGVAGVAARIRAMPNAAGAT